MFIFGRALEPAQVFDREKLVENLVERCAGIKKGVKRDYALMGARRIGKTSIVRKALGELEEKGVKTVLFDCQGLEFGLEELDAKLFVKLYGAAVMERFLAERGLKERIADKILEVPSKTVLFLSEFLGKTKALKIDLLNEWIQVAIEFEKNEPSPQELFSHFEKTVNLPELLAEKTRSHVVVALDEFQLLAKLKFGGKSVLPVLRKNFGNHKRVSYVVCGSNVGLMQELVLSLKSPFGANFFVERVEPFDAETAKRFLVKNFKEEGVEANGEAIDEIVAFTGGHPAYLNWFGEKLVQEKKGKKNKIGLDAVKKVEEGFFEPFNLGYLFEREIAKLKRTKALSKTYRVLRAMSEHGLHSPSEIARELEIDASNVVTYLNRLKLYGFVVKRGEGDYEVVDALLAKYLAAR